MASIWDSIKETADVLKSSVEAPSGLVLDLSSMVFGDEDLSFGGVAAAASKRGNDLIAPISKADPYGPESDLAGTVFSRVLEGANWALWNGVSEPAATASLAFSHASTDGGIGSLFDGATWSKAYQQAQYTSAGEAVSFGLLNTKNRDPFDYKDPYNEVTTEEHSILGPTFKWGTNVIGAWYLDPLVIAGKAAGAAKSLFYTHRMTEAQRGRLYADLTNGGRDGLRRNAQSRTDQYLDWIGGKNSQGRPLEAPEILHGTPELKKYAAEPHVIAGLLADSNKIANPVERRNAARRILAVAAGDTSQITRLQAQQGEAAHIADALGNMAKGGTLDLKLLAAAPTLRTDPRFIAHLEKQLANLNKDGAIDRFVDGWNSRLEQILETQHTMPALPGVHAAGERAVNRLNDTGLLRAPKNIHKEIDAWAAKRATSAQSASSVFQKGAYTVPLVAVKTAGLMASPYTKAPVAISDALRQVHFTGLAHLDDWGGSASQLDAMMTIGGVPHAERWRTLSEVYLAKTEPEKARIIERVESLTMRSLTRKYGEKFGHEIDDDFITELMMTHAGKRGASLAHLRGRVYAATEMPDSMLATRAGSLNRAADEARTAGATQGKRSWETTSAPERKWRVDQINDDGTPLSLPLLEPQLINTVPLFDVSLATKVLDRESSRLSRLSKAWKAEQMEIGRLSRLKEKGGAGLEKTIAARRMSADWLVDASQKLLRGWKFSVLFRLGYPVRVLMDDHWRIWTQMNALSFYGKNGREAAANLGYNTVGRGRAATAEMNTLRAHRQAILDELDGDAMRVHGDRVAELRSLRSGAGGLKGARTRLQSRITEAEAKRDLGLEHGDLAALTKRMDELEAQIADKEAAISFKLEELGDYGPDALRKELARLEDEISAGVKARKGEKRTIGQRDVVLDDGVSIPGAFAGAKGSASYNVSSSSVTFETQLRGVEDRTFKAGMGGSHRTYQADEPGHLEAWADALNHQIRNSAVAMHFIKGGDTRSFVQWLRQPEQATLRQRLAHFAHDPEDWAERVQTLIHDYIPTEALREAVEGGRVTARQLGKMFTQTERPAVHGRSLADNLGTSQRTLGVSKVMNRLYKMLGEMPTDNLSRHPFFNSMYQQHAKTVYATKKAGMAEGAKFTPRDLEDIERAARKLALHDVRRTLFDISAHSHAAHVMRFVSPFFAAHQESLSRWWRIVGDDPSVVRRFAMGFDLPRWLGIAVDEDGELVKPGAAISFQNRWLLQLPKEWGGDDTDPDNPKSKWSKWSISENAFNIILQSGVTNPGAGPLVAVPMAYLSEKYADEPEITRLSRVFNPYPPNSPMEAAVPATLKRLAALTYGKTGTDPTLGLGIGQREYNMAYSQNVQDAMVDFRLETGREPTKAESEELMLKVGRETNTQMFHRVLWNAGSPAPAQPRSKYSIIQNGWYRISEQARSEDRDFDWAYAQFKKKYGDAYMPLVYSSANNPAYVDANPGSIAAIKRYRGVLNRIDPALTRAVIGGYADDLIEQNAVMGEFTPEARAFLRTNAMKPGSPDTYYSYDDPRTAMTEQMARRGWQKYGELTGALTAQAQAMGLDSYRDSPQLDALRKAGVAKLMEENFAFKREYENVDGGKFDAYLDDLRVVAKSPVLAGDTERTDIKVLGAYLQLRDMFVSIFDQRNAAGFGGPDAQANDELRALYTSLVGRLVESNTYFETNIYNGVLDRDPLLVGD